MSTFTKLPSGKVIFDSGVDVIALSPNLNIFAHPREENFILITDDTNPQETEKGLKLDWRYITAPANIATRNAMITELATDFFFSVEQGTDPNILLIKTETDKIPALVAEVEIIEEHLHNNVFGLGLAATPNAEIHRADRTLGNSNPFVLTSGSSAPGAWVQILGSADTPLHTGKTHFDLNKVLVTNASDANFYVVQLAHGELADLPAKITAGEYSEFGFVRESATVISNTNVITMKRLPAGTKMWARCSCNGQNAKTMSFYFAIHEYPS